MVEIASIKRNGFALETIMYLFALALLTNQLHYLQMFASLALAYLRFHEEQLMPFIALHRPQSQFIPCYCSEVILALLAENDLALFILEVVTRCLVASHAA